MPSLMKSNLKRRIDKLKLIKANHLMPLYEAVINSIQSIYDNKDLESSKDGNIEVFFDRKDKTQTHVDFKSEEDLKMLPVRNIVITDNGCGFIDKNFDSFITYDTDLKEKKGGQGTGRLLWLKAFKSVEIESFYKENDKYYKIKFPFTIDNEGVDSDFVEKEEITQADFKFQTIIRLDGLKDEYQEQYSQNLDTIGRKIINHFISYFVNSDKCPRIVIKNDFDSELLNTTFNNSLLSENIEQSSFNLNNLAFNLHYLRIKDIAKGAHKLHFCADSREVYNINLKNYIPNLSSKWIDRTTNEEFYYQIFMTGKYLDESVDQDRAGFIFDESSLFTNSDEITTAAIKQIKEDIKDQLEKIESEKFKSIKSYITKNSPQYRLLLNDKYKTQLENIPPSARGKELDIKLYDEYYKVNKEAKQKTRELLSKKPENKEDLEFLNNKFKDYVDQINEVGKSKLSEYVAYRKSVLDLLSKLQKQQDDSKYPLEKAIHQMIFPMNKTSDDIDYENHNLWAIDEKLAYHYYLASDKKLKSMEVIESDSGKEPDITIFNHQFLLTDNERINTVTIIEFKRPERNDYTDDENPVKQIIEYVKDLRESKAKDKQGETITINANTPIYAYIITSLTPKVINIAKDSGYLTAAPDNSGYFGFHPSHNIYFEIISYKKMIQDARDRNKILFDKLNL